MTNSLEQAFAEFAELPEQDQDEMAALILDETEDGCWWDESFARSADVLERLADEARAERRAGRTLPLNPEAL
jgi:hypothetical protein